MSVCADPTCWRVPHHQLDHLDPAGLLARLSWPVKEARADLARRIEDRLAATGKSNTAIARDKVIEIIREEAAR